MGELSKLEAMVGSTLAADVAGAVAAGEYDSPEAVVRSALEAWRRDRVSEHERLRALILPALTSEPLPGNLDADDIKRRGRDRLSRRA